MRPRQSRLRVLRLFAAGLTAILLASLWCSGQASWAQGTATVRVEPPTVEIPPGETATISILVEDVNDLFCFELKVGFDPAKLEVVDANPDAPRVQIADGDFLSPDWKLQNAVDNEQGTVAYALCQLNPSEPQGGAGVLATITWRAKEPGTSPVRLHDVILAAPLGKRIPADIQNGEIVVRSAQPAPTGTETPSPTSSRTTTASPPSPTPSAVPASDTPLPTSTDQPEQTAGAAEASSATETPAESGAQTPTPGHVTQEPTSTAAGDDAPTATPPATSRQSPTPSPTGKLARGEGDTPSPTDTVSDTPATTPPSVPGATAAEVEATGQSQPTRTGPGESSSPILLGVAAGCLILGIGALIAASILWRRKHR